VGARLRALRRERAWSLGDLAARAGVSRAMLSQVESGKTTPSIAVLWKVAGGLGLPFSALLGAGGDAPGGVVRRAAAATLSSRDGRFRSRPLSPVGPGRRVELYELTLAPRARSRSGPHAAGTRETLVVVRGRLRLRLGDRAWDLGPGDTVEFAADVEHVYENPHAAACVAHDVIVYG
jgi:transcriptional regulator with XRE-family HTH domain